MATFGDPMQLTSLAKRLGFTTLPIGSPDPREAQPGCGFIAYNEMELSVDWTPDGTERPISDKEMAALQCSAEAEDAAAIDAGDPAGYQLAFFQLMRAQYRQRVRQHGLLRKHQLLTTPEQLQHCANWRKAIDRFSGQELRDAYRLFQKAFREMAELEDDFPTDTGKKTDLAEIRALLLDAHQQHYGYHIDDLAVVEHESTHG